MDELKNHLDPEWHYIDAFRVIREQSKKDYAHGALAKAVSKYVADEIARTLASIQETHAIVPREPTEAMAEAGFETLICNKDPWMPAAKNTYQAMIEAANPQPPLANHPGDEADC